MAAGERKQSGSKGGGGSPEPSAGELPLTPEQAAAVEAQAAPLEEALLKGTEAEDGGSAGREAADGGPISDDEARVAETARERDEYLALAQRTQADFENYRKRSARDLAAAEGRGITKLARDLLPALDNLHLALAAIGEDQHVADGIRLVESELSAALARHGIEAFSPDGERFDPAEHEAVAQQPVEGAEAGTVVEVYQRGYRLKSSGGDTPAVLRPARVVVAG